MSRFTPLQLTLLSVFCLYWFVFFPFVWFAVRPSIFVSDFWQAMLFAIFLLIIYCVLHLVIVIAFEMCEERRERGTVLPSDGQQQQQQQQLSSMPLPPPDTVIYKKIGSRTQTQTQKSAAVVNAYPVDPELRFVSSFQLFYDGNQFRDHGPVRNF